MQKEQQQHRNRKQREWKLALNPGDLPTVKTNRSVRREVVRIKEALITEV
jgi:murein L,D-transpeptidase YafK